MTDKLNLALAQTHPKFADMDANVQQHLDLMRQAAEQGAQLIVFPELSLTGYYLQDLVREVAITVDDEPLQKLRDESAKLDIDVMVGYVERTPRSNYRIASAYIEAGEVLHVHHKCYLPTYAQFDDMRYFEVGDHIRAFDTRHGRMGMLICEDFWHLSASYLLWLDGAEVMLFHSASPGRGVDERDTLGTQRGVDNSLQVFGGRYTTHVVHCNRVGFEGGTVFWGGSSVVEPNGEFIYQAPNFEETLGLVELDLAQAERSRRLVATLRDERWSLTLREMQRMAGEKLPTK